REPNAARSVGFPADREREDDGFSVLVADTTGRPVVTVGSLVWRPLPEGDLHRGDDSLFEVDWVPVPLPPDEAAPEDADGLVVLRCPEADVHESVESVLARIQAWLAEDPLSQARLVVLTRGAVSGENLAGAAVWGLVRSAQTEHPGRIVLVDIEGGGDL